MKAAIVKTLLAPPKKKIRTTITTVAQDNKEKKKGQKKNIAEVACRQALLKRSGVAAAAGKYLWSCHGTRPRLRILFKQSLSEHREGDGDTVSLRLPCGPLSQHHTPCKQWSHAGTGRVPLNITDQGGFGGAHGLEGSRGVEVQVRVQGLARFAGKCKRREAGHRALWREWMFQQKPHLQMYENSI